MANQLIGYFGDVLIGLNLEDLSQYSAALIQVKRSLRVGTADAKR